MARTWEDVGGIMDSNVGVVRESGGVVRAGGVDGDLEEVGFYCTGGVAVEMF